MHGLRTFSGTVEDNSSMQGKGSPGGLAEGTFTGRRKRGEPAPAPPADCRD